MKRNIRFVGLNMPDDYEMDTDITLEDFLSDHLYIEEELAWCNDCKAYKNINPINTHFVGKCTACGKPIDANTLKWSNPFPLEVTPQILAKIKRLLLNHNKQFMEFSNYVNHKITVTL